MRAPPIAKICQRCGLDLGPKARKQRRGKRSIYACVDFAACAERERARPKPGAVLLQIESWLATCDVHHYVTEYLRNKHERRAQCSFGNVGRFLVEAGLDPCAALRALETWLAGFAPGVSRDWAHEWFWLAHAALDKRCRAGEVSLAEAKRLERELERERDRRCEGEVGT